MGMHYNMGNTKAGIPRTVGKGIVDGGRTEIAAVKARPFQRGIAVKPVLAQLDLEHRAPPESRKRVVDRRHACRGQQSRSLLD